MKKENIEKIVHDNNLGMSIIVKTIARMMIAPVLLFGFYIMIFGHLTPGGGFAGGVILAIAYTLMFMAFSKKMALAKFSGFWASMWDNLGMLAFIVIGFIGLNVGFFMFNFIAVGEPFKLVSAGIIPLENIAIGIKVGAALYAIFIGLSIYERILIQEED